MSIYFQGALIEVAIYNGNPTFPPRLSIHPQSRRVRFVPKRSALPYIRAYFARRYGITVA